MKNYYQILEVKETASEAEIHKAFRTLAQTYHPDTNKDPKAQDKFREINEAYQTLKDAIRRHAYDLQRRAERGESAAPSPGPAPAEARYYPPEYYARGGNTIRQAKPKPRWVQMVAAFLQLALWLVIGMALGVAVTLARRLFLGLEDNWLWFDLVAGAVLGALAGLTLPQENKLQQRLKERLKDGYLLLKMLGSTLSGLFFGAYIADIIAFQFDLDYASFDLAGALVGEILFGFGAAVEAFWTKLRLIRAYGELLFVFIRMLGVAVFVGSIAFFTSVLLNRLEISVDILPLTLQGVIIGVMIGSIAPSDLRAYARYASAYVGRLMVLLLIGGALAGGIALGMLFRPWILSLF